MALLLLLPSVVAHFGHLPSQVELVEDLTLYWHLERLTAMQVLGKPAPLASKTQVGVGPRGNVFGGIGPPGPAARRLQEVVPGTERLRAPMPGEGAAPLPGGTPMHGNIAQNAGTLHISGITGEPGVFQQGLEAPEMKERKKKMSGSVNFALVYSIAFLTAFAFCVLYFCCTPPPKAPPKPKEKKKKPKKEGEDSESESESETSQHDILLLPLQGAAPTTTIVEPVAPVYESYAPSYVITEGSLAPSSYAGTSASYAPPAQPAGLMAGWTI